MPASQPDPARGRPTARHAGLHARAPGSALACAALILLAACSAPREEGKEAPAPASPAAADTGAAAASAAVPHPQYTLTRDQTHNRWSRTIPPVLRVPSGAVIEAFTEEATDGQLTPESGPDAIEKMDFGLIHPLTGPVYVEGADPGDVLAVTLHEIEVGDWGWAAVAPHFGFLSDEYPDAWIRTWRFSPGDSVIHFAPGIDVPIAPFAGVMGVAPDTDSLLVTIPPRANGGNMDNHDLTAGTTVYFPVFVKGALFSLGDTHAAQGDGEVSGTAVEAPMRIVYSVRVIEGGRKIREPQYETDDYYGVTAFGPDLDEAAKKATRYMIDYLVDTRGLDRTQAYVLVSLAGNLQISEVVDVPHVLVSLRMPKRVIGRGTDV